MRRVVITGMGLVSSLGNDLQSVSTSLREGRSGIRFNPTYAEVGMRSQVCGAVPLDMDSLNIDRKVKRFMGDAAAYAYLAMQQAVKDAGLSNAQVSNPRTGLIAGSGGASSFNQMEAMDILREKGIARVGPFRVPRTMSNTVSACLATPFRIKGLSYSIASACASSAHCIGHAMEQIRMGKQDIVFAGGGEEEHWSQSYLFDAMGALSSQYNDAPQTRAAMASSSRPGAVSWWSKRWSMPWHATRRSMRKSSVTAPRQTATTWSRPAVKAACVACRMPWSGSPSRSIT
jgi:3-oxoacyl-[acyl-carrier-protein] synthase-1